MKNSIDKKRYSKALKLAIKNYYDTAKENLKDTLIGLGLPAIGSILIFYIPPILVTKIVENTLRQGFAISEVLIYIVLFGISWILGEIAWRIGIHFIIKAEHNGVKSLYEKGLQKILRHDLDFFINSFSGSLTKKTNGYAYRFVDVMDTMLFNVFPSIIPAIFAIIYLMFYSPILGLTLLGWIVLTTVITLPFIKKRKSLVDEREEANNVISGHIADIYTNIEAVKSHASESQELLTHKVHIFDYAKKMKKSWDYQNNVIDMIISPLYIVTNVSGLALSVYLASKGSIPASSIIVVFAYYTLVTRFMWEFNGIYRRLETALADASQFTELILDEPLIKDPDLPTQNQVRKGNIVFEKVTFSYENNDNELFKDFNLTIKSGEKIGLIGRSGGGKTSITKLLLRFIDIESGALKIDEIKINKMTQKDLRSLIAYVPQDPVMFHRTIAENIAYGKPNSTKEEMVEAAKKAHAHEFIKDLSIGYDTLVGERGVKLSGGQRQRVAIARAILRNAPILLLDEATSALDSESEVLIQDALKKLMKNRTAIVIAHRLSTVQNMDRIIVLEKGQIIEEGNHKELISKNGTYAKLWSHQSGGFLDD